MVCFHIDNVYIVILNIYKGAYACVHVCAGVHTYFATAALISGQLVNKQQANSKKKSDICRIKVNK